jgi:hypothetical protein
MTLNQTVHIALPEEGQFVWQPAIVVGRTLEADPHYDVRLQDGKIIADVPTNHLRMV